MNKKSAITLSVIVAVILVISYCYWGTNGKHEGAFPANMPPVESTEAKAAAASNPTPPPNDTETAPVTTDSAGFLPTKMEDPERFELLQKNLKEMSKCLKVEMGPLNKGDDMNFETLNEIVGPNLGDVVHEEQEWSSTDIKTNSGEIRRIFVQNGISENGAITRKLKYYSMNPQGGQKELPLSKEQSLNPTETLLASLESDGQLVTKSLARKIFYQNGDDLSLVEKNGRIYSFGLGHEGSSFSCQGVDSSKNMKCSCK